MKRNVGFTLMELLIVIGVLGILAAGLLAAIDPFEQLKKARDSNYRSAALEFLSANQRYMANHGYFPWTDKGACEAAVGANSTNKYLDPSALSSDSAKVLAVGGGVGMGDFQTCLENNLIGDGELKSTFSQGLAATVYFSTWGKTNVRICYAPEGKSSRADATTNMHLVTNAGSTTIVPGCDLTQRNAGECVQCFQ